MNSGEKVLLSPETMHGVCRHSWSWGLGGSWGWFPALCPSSRTLLSLESPADGPLRDSNDFLDALLISLLEEAPVLTEGRAEQERGLHVSGLAPHDKGV